MKDSSNRENHASRMPGSNLLLGSPVPVGSAMHRQLQGHAWHRVSAVSPLLTSKGCCLGHTIKRKF